MSRERARVTARFEEAVAAWPSGPSPTSSPAWSSTWPRRLTGARRRRLAQGVPRFGHRQPGRVLRAVPHAQRPLEHRARRGSVEAGAAGRPRRFTPQGLRDGGAMRGERVAAGLSQVRESLDSLLVDRPQRRVLRPESTGERIDGPRCRPRRASPLHLWRGARPRRGSARCRSSRASHVEPEGARPAGSPTWRCWRAAAGPYTPCGARRLAAERAWLEMPTGFPAAETIGPGRRPGLLPSLPAPRTSPAHGCPAGVHARAMFGLFLDRSAS